VIIVTSLKIRSYNDQHSTGIPETPIAAPQKKHCPNAQTTASKTGTSNCRQPGKLIIARHTDGDNSQQNSSRLAPSRRVLAASQWLKKLRADPQYHLVNAVGN
jgi:hypothetical protein